MRAALLTRCATNEWPRCTGACSGTTAVCEEMNWIELAGYVRRSLAVTAFCCCTHRRTSSSPATKIMTTAASTIPKFVIGYRFSNGRGVGIKGRITGAQASYIVRVLMHFNRTKTCPNCRQCNTHKLQEIKRMGFIVLTFNSVSGTQILEQSG